MSRPRNSDEGDRLAPPAGRGARLRYLQLNCRRSEAVLLLLQHHIGTCGHVFDILFLQDLPVSLRRGRSGVKGFQLFLARSRDSTDPETGLLVKDSIACREMRPFGPRVVGLEIPGPGKVLRIFSAYIQHTTGEGVRDLEIALRWALAKGGRVVAGLDSNGHSPLWAPPPSPLPIRWGSL